MQIAVSVLLLVLLSGTVQTFVFSCNELKYKLINTIFTANTRYVCLVAQENYGHRDELQYIYAQAGHQLISFRDLLTTTCIERRDPLPWRIGADIPYALDCSDTDTQELSLVFTSSSIDFYPTLTTYNELEAASSVFEGESVIVNPAAGIVLRKRECTGSGNVTFYTGAGTGEEEDRFFMASWKCADLSHWIISFDNVITVIADADVQLTMVYETLYIMYWPTLSPIDSIVFFSSGRSDNLQNLYYYMNDVQFYPKTTAQLTMSGTGSFDYRYGGYVNLQNDDYTPHKVNFYNGTHTWSGLVNQFAVTYWMDQIAEQDLWNTQDNFVCELSFVAQPTPSSTARYRRTTKLTTPIAPTTVPSSTNIDSDPYCGCALESKFGMPDGWDSKEIWMDVVIILDTSEAMGDVALVDACSLIESFIGTSTNDVLITDTKAKFYTRIGLIAMSDTADVIYNLNMTKYDKVQGKVQTKKGLIEIDVVKAFNAAVQMLNDGLTPDRAFTRQVIYYITDTDPIFDHRPLNGFKESGGIIIVNDFIEPGEPERSGLKELASPGYFYSDIQYNYMASIQLFCKANCFCRRDKDQVPYAGQNQDPAVRVSGGCFYAAPVGIPFEKAQSNCAGIGGGLIASVHDDDKAAFLNDLLGDVKSDYFWIGYSKTDMGWTWEDHSTNTYTHWAPDEPSSNPIATCAYVDRTSSELFWGAGNCNVGFPSVCEFAPCSVGNKC